MDKYEIIVIERLIDGIEKTNEKSINEQLIKLDKINDMIKVLLNIISNAEIKKLEPIIFEYLSDLTSKRKKILEKVSITISNDNKIMKMTQS